MCIRRKHVLSHIIAGFDCQELANTEKPVVARQLAGAPSCRNYAAKPRHPDAQDFS